MKKPSPAVTRLASKLKTQKKRKAMRQTPSPIKVAERVSEIEKKISKRSRKTPLATLEEVTTPAPVSAKAQLDFDFLQESQSKKSQDFRKELLDNSDDDFKSRSPNMLCELADLNRRHAKADVPAKQKRSARNKK